MKCPMEKWTKSTFWETFSRKFIFVTQSTFRLCPSYIMNSTGPRTLPWGTPLMTGLDTEQALAFEHTAHGQSKSC